MSKNNLTLEQKSIIKRLSDEFEKLNVSIPVSMGLIDISGIKEDARLEKEFNNECTLANSTFNRLKCDAMLKDMESIKGDLALLNLGVKRSYHNSDSFEIYPTHKPYDEVEHYYKIRIEYKDSHFYERKYKSIERNVQCRYCVSMDFNQISSVRKDTFAEFIQHPIVKDKLKYLYEQTIK